MKCTVYYTLVSCQRVSNGRSGEDALQFLEVTVDEERPKIINIDRSQPARLLHSQTCLLSLASKSSVTCMKNLSLLKDSLLEHKAGCLLNWQQSSQA